MTIHDLFDILLTDKPSDIIKMNEQDIFWLIPELKAYKEFEKTNYTQKYNIYEHTLKVVDNVPKNITLRLSALFLNIGKPSTYTIDEHGQEHYYDHWLVSGDMFKGFANKYKLDQNIKESGIKLITFQNIDIDKLTEKELKFITSIFNKEELIMLFELKKAELLARNKQYHYLLDNYKEQKSKVLKRYERK